MQWFHKALQEATVQGPRLDHVLQAVVVPLLSVPRLLGALDQFVSPQPLLLLLRHQIRQALDLLLMGAVATVVLIFVGVENISRLLRSHLQLGGRAWWNCRN